MQLELKSCFIIGILNKFEYTGQATDFQCKTKQKIIEIVSRLLQYWVNGFFCSFNLPQRTVEAEILKLEY
jgi:hypothetical protein